MLSESTISQVKALDIVDVIERYVDLKKKGANHVGLSPFTEEKSPSFSVNPAKQIYKCFSTGFGGDSISFVMENCKLTFIEAVKEIALAHNIAVEYDSQKQQTPQEVNTIEEYRKINKACARQYANKLLEILKLDYSEHITFDEIFNKRKLSLDTVMQFGLGFAPDEWKFLTDMIIEKGLYKPALELGIINTKNGNNYDVFRNRIMFPIHDINGHVIGFGGRKIEDNNKDNPKYINSPESKLYKKSETLYGLYFAQRAIRREGKAILTEGYYDVIGLHQAGVDIAVGPCGTALTKSQVKILKRFCQHIILMYDNDSGKQRNAGEEATMKAIDMLIEEGFKVDVMPLPDGADADSFAREFGIEKETASTEEIIAEVVEEIKPKKKLKAKDKTSSLPQESG